MKRSVFLVSASLLAVSCSISPAPEEKRQEAEADQIVVTGAEVGLASRVPTRASSAFAYAPVPEPMVDTSRFENGDDNPVKVVSEEPVSTFSADVDTTSYSVIRRYLGRLQLPPSEAVRVEELLNYFDYDYAKGTKENLFGTTVWVTPTPWSDTSELIHIGVNGYDQQPEEAPHANIVLLLDISGSMQAEDKLPLLKKSMNLLIDQMGPDDRISIVTYASGTGVVLEPTSGKEKVKIKKALERLQAGGSTAGAAGLSLAYDLAQENFDEDAINRVILATDGDFNVGITGDDPLEDYVARKRDTGIYLSVLGFGGGNLNDTMMQRIAQNGNGIAAYIDTMEEAQKVLVREFRSSVFPIAEDLKFQIEFNPEVISEYRLIGYQTRILDREDFNNDAVDAGDIGSGHTVTALYEITRNGEPGLIDPLRYGSRQAVEADPSAELAFLKIRYKPKGEKNSVLRTRPITPGDVFDSLERAPTDARFAAAVAAYGEKLSRSNYVADYSWDDLIQLALGARGNDPYGERVGFVNLARRAKSVSGLEE